MTRSVQTEATDLTLVEFAEILFTTPLQQSARPSPDEARDAVLTSLRSCAGDVSQFAAQLAQAAGDHPELTTRRMAWALRTAEQTFVRYLPLAG